MNAPARWWVPTHPVGATLSYVVIAAAFTWPLVAGVTHLVPWDVGDPLLNDWILAWHYHQAGLVLSGDWSALSAWWHPPIFYPSPYAIGYSELLVTQALLGAPVYALTGNILLTYNLLFIGSFVLSALGAFLLVRQMTGDARAGWLAGILYGFALYRVNQGPHIQVLHSQWAPFALWYLHRWLDRGHWRDAALGGLALAAQNLSNGYYLFYLALLLPPYVVGQLLVRRRLLDRRAWAGVAVLAIIGIAVTAPFMYPYLQLRAHGQAARPLAAVANYGADTFAWFTANDQLRLWGWLRTLPRPEGDLFPGLVPVLLAIAGIALVFRERLDAHQDAPLATTWRRRDFTARRLVAGTAALLVAWHTLAILLALFADITRVALGPLVLSFGNGGRLLLQWTLCVTVLLATSARARRAMTDTPRAPVVLLSALAALTIWLSFGPVIRIGGRPSSSWPALYAYLYESVPGADALRVPPRIAMMTALLLTMLGGIGAAALHRRGRLHDGVLVAVAATFLAEAWPAPVPVNLPYAADPYATAPGVVPPHPARDEDARALAQLPASAVLVELPIGSQPWEIRWQYLQAGHWRARLNGYSGGFPADHSRLQEVLGSLPARTDEAARLLADRGVTHVVLHPEVWQAPDTVDAVRDWLRALGATRTSQTPALDVWQLR